MRSALLLVAIPLAAMAACTGSAADPNDDEPSGFVRDVPEAGRDTGSSPFDGPRPWPEHPAHMIDVAILFPLGAAADLDRNYLAATSMGKGGVLLPASLYDAIGGIVGRAGAKAPREDLRVVGVRIDPCFADTAPPANGVGCRNQLRVVFQELGSTDGATIDAADSGLHAFYTLERDELRAIAAELVALRMASDPAGVHATAGLAPHAIMAKEGLSGPFATALRAIVLAHAGSPNLVRVTKMGAIEPGKTWHFAGYDILAIDGPQLAPLAIPTLKDDGVEQTFTRGDGADLQGVATPTTIADDDLMPLANTDRALALDAAARSSAFASLLHVEHPAKETPSIIDCVSCHVALPAKKLVAEPKLGLSANGNPEGFAFDPRSVTAAEMSPAFDANAPLNVHAFSYVGKNPGINQRTVNEAAAITAYLNQNVL